MLIFIAIMGFTYFDKDNFEPFILEEKGGWSGTIKGATIIFFAYLGFDFITTLAEEAKQPRRDLPRSILLTIVICAMLYTTIALSLSGMARIHTF